MEFKDVYEFQSAYEAKIPDAQGYVKYSVEENAVWHDLYVRQMQILTNRACEEHMQGLKTLHLSETVIPQIPSVNQALKAASGWEASPVAALISHEEFFQLLANAKFPAATFIRSREHFDYVKEPDIFHEIFGHCPMLSNPVFADFVQAYGKMVLNMDQKDWLLLQRLFWFTVEFGLIQTPEGLRIYGGGILSSVSETAYSVDSNLPDRHPFDIVEVLRTPYRIDIMQPVYYVINRFEQLYDLLDQGKIPAAIKKARQLGELTPKFKVEAIAGIHINAC